MKILFIVNPGSGSQDETISELISKHFQDRNVDIELYELPDKCSKDELNKVIRASDADRVVAAGGDGTLKLVATSLIGTSVPVGILPTGSANGMAKELGIPTDLEQALHIIEYGQPKKIHTIKFDEEFCIHLSDLGFNAYLVKKFDAIAERGMWGYAKATWHALWNHKRIEVEMDIDGQTIRSGAAMVAIANATQYGTGLKINPNGRLDDDLFEVILVKDYSYLEILKVWFTRLPFNPKKIEVFQTHSLQLHSRHPAHFQVDGEYMGKVNTLKAELLPASLSIIVAV